ncbi:MAG: hypothetical protein Kow001_03230 [Acidobacteriota bacterium]
MSLVALLQVLSPVVSAESLRPRVEAFWQAVLSQDRQAAAAMVEPDGRSRFDSIALLPIHSWRLVRLETAPSGKSALVVVDCVLRHDLGRFPTRVTQRWNLHGDAWWLEVPEGSAGEINRLLYGVPAPAVPRRDRPSP